MALDRTLHAFL